MGQSCLIGTINESRISRPAVHAECTAGFSVRQDHHPYAALCPQDHSYKTCRKTIFYIPISENLCYNVPSLCFRRHLMFYLALAIAISAMVSIVMRVSTGKVTGNLSMLAVNYLMCLFLSFLHTGPGNLLSQLPGMPLTLGMGLFNGILYLSGFVLLQISMRKNGVVLSSTFMKLGLLVPMVASVLLFREVPGALQIFGFCLALAAIVLINYEKGAAKKGSVLLPVLLLVVGVGDTMSKIFEVYGNEALSSHFLLFTFASAFVCSVLMVLLKKEKLTKAELFYGLLIGVPNFYSAKFLLMALGHLPAILVYPCFSAGSLLLVTLTGVLAFREKLKLRQWLALGMILVSLILLNM